MTSGTVSAGSARQAPLGWAGIVRLGLVQSAIGGIVMLATSLLNRVMVVEYALPAALPAGLVAWHYTVQLTRPMWGHGSDRGGRRTPWIIGGMALLAIGMLLAVAALGLLATHTPAGYLLAILAYAMVGAGVGAAGTSLLALLASRVSPERRAAAASITWIMMVFGIVLTAGAASTMLSPFSLTRLATVTGGISGAAFLIATVAVWGTEGQVMARHLSDPAVPRPSFGTALREIWVDDEARRFTIFVALSMLAYSMQDLILEPFSGLLFGFTPARSTQLSAVQHGGVLAGMILVGVCGGAFGGRGRSRMGRWIVAGCVGSALALAGLAVAARAGAGWPLSANIAALGFFNGMFAVAAIGAMMALAGAGARSNGGGSEGIRMGVWGAAQAIAFGAGGLLGAVGLDVGRAITGSTRDTFTIVFAVEAGLFVAAALLALNLAPRTAPPRPLLGAAA